MKIDSFLFTNTGGREHNEDAVGVRELIEGGLFAVADGLGGHMYGERASAFAVKSITEAELPEPQPEEWLADQIEKANEGILALQEETHSNMKSTVATLLIQEDRASWAHVGDTRLYYFHNGELAFVTEDHSVACLLYTSPSPRD